MQGLVEHRRGARAVALIPVSADQLEAQLASLGDAARQWVQAQGFKPDAGALIAVPAEDGSTRCVLAGVGSRRDDVYALASLPLRLPAGDYRLATDTLDPVAAALGWTLGSYQFTRYRKARRAPARLSIDSATWKAVAPLAEAVYRVRDLVNTPTQDMGPAELCGHMQELASEHGAKFREWVGDQLLKANFPTIHAVGRASHRPPRLAELTWGKKGPHVVIIGKGVCFDTGGLDIKPADGMRWMKKDMGGAAHAIALAGLIMRTRLPIRLTLLVPAVENAIAGNAYRPGEVITTRAGITVEIDNTDAEGRLVLCDAISYAAEQKPDLLLDFATLTGAARVALGPDLPGVFANRDDLADSLLEAGRVTQDPLWRMPLWRPYLTLLESSIADIANAGASRHAGAITAALYLERFVPESLPWVHLDVYSWNDGERPGKPKGGEAQGLRAYYAFLQRRYG
ncbi:leucyl aminopeptidase family protein [Tahibacter amnicola]|uniref:Leucyl aminopeptidase family protein n=1 Tax=Tahibacter amnicola TaxID=2976241 RepID=A0ABY6BHA6_9GAMM|nr:leucyl aminopeptidase family protein [Tahibacter amnicola]UXI67991.1 leucyl aminopeptidase family protein [Tahibacter amnicola]